MKTLATLLIGMTSLGLLAALPALTAEVQPRARDLAIPFAGKPGLLNAITDVKGVEVGHVTLVKGDGALVIGEGPIRTGVTAIHPRGKNSTHPVFASWFTLNASGEMTGTTWLEERGLLDGPVLITNTHSVGVVRDAAVSWMVDKGWPAVWHAPVVAETYDGSLNDINGFHVTKDHALEALQKAKSGSVEEGAVGGGTGMICNGFKGGIGTSSRIVADQNGENYTIGVLVQCNYGQRRKLTIAGIPIEKNIHADANCYVDPTLTRHSKRLPYCGETITEIDKASPYRDGSIIVIVATDAPLLPHQLKRLAKRPTLAMGKLGATSNGGSGDIFLAFSTADNGQLSENNLSTVTMYPNNQLSALFEATVQATEESIVNALVAAKTTKGVNGLRIEALPTEQLKELMLLHAQ
jgi:L-aminopeptidase/D-esterase-like protein